MRHACRDTLCSSNVCRNHIDPKNKRSLMAALWYLAGQTLKSKPWLDSEP